MGNRVSRDENFVEWYHCTGTHRAKLPPIEFYQEVCICQNWKIFWAINAFKAKCLARCKKTRNIFLNQSVVPTVTTDIPLVSSANFLVIGVASMMPFFLTFF